MVALDEFRRRVGDQEYVSVVVDAGNEANVPAAERFLDDLAARVQGYPSTMVVAVRTGDEQERAFLEKYGPLYVDVADLETAQGRIEARRDYEVAQKTGTLLEDRGAPPLDFQDLRSKYDERLGGASGRANPRFTDHARHLSVLLIELTKGSSGTEAGRHVLGRLKADIAQLGGTERYAHGMRYGFAGDATIAVEELTALITDLSVSSVIVVLAVMGAIILFYRWWQSVLVVIPPLLLATVYAFGLASLPPLRVDALNSNTAFLGSIIVGNGINFGLILLARYVEERRAGKDVRASLEHAVAGARAGTLAAALSAGVSYVALAITSFRGFRQFGFIGGFGMFFAWVLAFVLMPSLIAWLDTGESTRPKPRSQRSRASVWVTHAVARAPRLILLATVALTLASVVAVVRFRADADLETDFSRLRRRDTWKTGEGYWGERMNQVLGEYLNPLAFVGDHPEDASHLADRLRAEKDKPPFAGRIETIRTLSDVLPTDQEEKIREIDVIGKDLTPAVRSSLTPDQKRDVDRFIRPGLHPITLADLPRTFATGLRERDLSMGNVVLVFPSLASPWWDGRTMREFVDGLRRVARETSDHHTPPRLAGAIPLSTDIIDAMWRDGPLASAVAFLGVVAVVILLLGRRQATLYVIGALAVGVLWLAGVRHMVGIRINFANFIAFPITFGIGVDYAVNVISRYEQDGSRDILESVRSTGAAVALCSTTTIIGYSSLLMAKNQALFHFGLLAVLGELCCLTVALVSLPALILVLSGKAPLGAPAGERRSLAHVRG